jgi:hypothetical protein
MARVNEDSLVGNQMQSVDVFFPMAGQGARFGYQFKPFLTIGADPFIAAAVRPFRAHADRIERFVFVYLAQQEREFDVRAQLARMFEGLPFETVLLDAPTRGPAETIGSAIERIGARGPAFICDCDHEVDIGPLFDVVARGEPYDVLLPVWSLAGENLAAWSVAMVERGEVLAIAEKQMPAGSGTPMGVIGCYGFRDIADAAARAARLGATNFSDVIAQMLSEGRVVRAARIERATFFGDPDRLAKAHDTRSA